MPQYFLLTSPDPPCLGAVVCLCVVLGSSVASTTVVFTIPVTASTHGPSFSHIFLGEGDLEHEELVPPCVGCVDAPACLELAWGSLCGVDLSCISLEAHFSPSCLSLIPLFPLSSETVLSTGGPVRTGSDAGCHGWFRCWGGQLRLWAVSDQGLQRAKRGFTAGVSQEVGLALETSH